MEKITIKELVEFRTKSSDKSKRNFALKLKTRKAKEKKEEDCMSSKENGLSLRECLLV